MFRFLPDFISTSCPASTGPWCQDRKSCTQAGLRIVKKLQHERMVIEGLLNDAALNAVAPAVNQPNLPQSCRVCLADVLVDHRRDVFWREGVKIEARLDRNPHRVVLFHLGRFLVSDGDFGFDAAAD